MRNLIHLSKYFAQRNSTLDRKSFGVVEERDVRHFRSIMNDKQVITDPYEVEPFNIEFRKNYKGQSSLVVCPKNTEEVSQVLKYCNERRLAVVPQGGNTGLVGGSVPVFDEVILSLRAMDRIEGFDPVSGVVSVEAGVVLQKLNNFLAPHGCEAPLDLGAKGSCMLGGNAATHAGGKYVLRHGPLRAHVRGLQAVLPGGEVLDLRSSLAKDNTGYDLKQLFVGSEGTLGVITRLNLHCPKSDPFRKILVFKTDNFSNIVNIVPRLKSLLGKDLNALECMDEVAYRTVITQLHPPIFDKLSQNQYLLFIQTSRQQVSDLIDLMSDFSDGIMSNSDSEFQRIWKIRQDVAIAARMCGKVLAYDLSYQVKNWPKLVAELRSSINAEIMGYGHIGDGNIHINMILKEGQAVNDQQVYETVVKEKGSISAEHGVGLTKAKYLHLQKSPLTLSIYRQLKQVFDPHGIMNPYKLIPN